MRRISRRFPSHFAALAKLPDGSPRGLFPAAPGNTAALETLCAVHKKQLLTYLRLSEKPVGLLINFNIVLIKDGILRTVNNLEES
ncbi:MAG: GxxExxY protein [Bryobacterales bacterium]|nr:GxxExxY protein [Bryobacterales bacterium]